MQIDLLDRPEGNGVRLYCSARLYNRLDMTESKGD